MGSIDELATGGMDVVDWTGCRQMDTEIEPKSVATQSTASTGKHV
jgi:hypothetical protein